MTYATQLRLHLARSLAAKLPFERAWSAAVAAHRPPSGWPIDDSRTHFRNAYTGHNYGATGSMGILVDREDGVSVDFPPSPAAPTEPPVRRCGSSAGCIAPVAPDRWLLVKSGPRRHKRVTVLVVEERPSYLCPTHQAEILAAIGRAEYRDKAETTFDMGATEALAA